MDNLFQSFNANISVSNFAELSGSVFNWLEEYCKPQVKPSTCWENLLCTNCMLYGFSTQSRQDTKIYGKWKYVQEFYSFHKNSVQHCVNDVWTNKQTFVYTILFRQSKWCLENFHKIILWLLIVQLIIRGLFGKFFLMKTIKLWIEIIIISMISDCVFNLLSFSLFQTLRDVTLGILQQINSMWTIYTHVSDFDNKKMICFG